MIGGRNVNPITGQRKEFETTVEKPEMTMEDVSWQNWHH